MTDTLKALIPPGSDLTWPDEKPDLERIMGCTIVGVPAFGVNDEGAKTVTVDAIRSNV